MITLEPTADGSNTLYVPELNEHYHSVKGALTESAHIFIQMGLNHAQAANPRVLEICKYKGCCISTGVLATISDFPLFVR
jgi:hypothetical protein